MTRGRKKQYGRAISMRLETFQVKFCEQYAKRQKKTVAATWRDILNAGIKYIMEHPEVK